MLRPCPISVSVDSGRETTVKKEKNVQTPKTISVKKNLIFWFYHIVTCPKDEDRIANSVDTDQTAPFSLICVNSVCPYLSVQKLITEPHSFEPPHDKTNKMACAPSEDLAQPEQSAQSDQSLRCAHEETLGP